MQPQTKPITAVFEDETRLNVIIKTSQRRQFLEAEELQAAMVANQLIPSADRHDLTRGVPHSALHD